MKPQELEAIKARAAAATPGEWIVRRMPRMETREGFVQAPRIDPKHPYDIEVLGEDDTLAADLEFVAHAHQDVPVLVEALEKAQRELAEIVENLDELEKQGVTVIRVREGGGAECLAASIVMTITLLKKEAGA